MDKDRLRELQLVQLSIMKDIHRVCEKHGLRYYLVYGSALGAIRHKGFIPWDVDIDIAMPRSDYDAFLDNYSKELVPRFKCVSYKTEKKYTSPHALVLMKNSAIIDKSGTRQTDLRPSEIFVDVFPLDVCPESKKEQERQGKKLKFIKAIKFRKASWIFPENSFVVRIIKQCIKLLLFPLSWKCLNTWEERVMKKYDETSKSGLWCSMAAPGYKNNTVPKEWYGNPKLVDFEDVKLYIAENAHEILKQTHGDYMQVPSKEQQQAQMDMFVDARW